MTHEEAILLDKLLLEVHNEAFGANKVSNYTLIFHACNSDVLELRNAGKIIAKRRGIQVVET